MVLEAWTVAREQAGSGRRVLGVVLAPEGLEGEAFDAWEGFCRRGELEQAEVDALFGWL